MVASGDCFEYLIFMRWLLIFLMGSCMALAESIRGVVINVIDGDTVTLLEKTPDKKQTYRIRLVGIDTPERGQEGYEGARECLKKLVWGETVTVRYTGEDRYGRILGEVWYGKIFVNEELVREGWAWIYKNFSASRKLSSYESEARKARKGLWAAPNPVPPWEWKAMKRNGVSAVEKGREPDSVER